ncbi:MAG: hypothetical protein IJ177_09600 [Fibrobacter sp.]|uniref:hypothetical protein n=1 Tax=Fibrobacter sp. TaxID=35828 RepID=UPI0025B880A1|nr:hypothetical protein [Fibrobacter sp.]MBQ9226426.1 hypothetical protein [Fibrobacter sp.]
MINYNNLQDIFVEDNGEQEKQMVMTVMKPFVKQRFLVARTHEMFNEDSFYIVLRDASQLFTNVSLDKIKEYMIQCIYEETQKLVDEIRLVCPQALNQISTRPKDRKR